MCRGRDHWRMGGRLRPALAPDVEIGELAAASTALQSVGVAHGARLVACDHPVVAGGTTVSAAVSGGGRVHREGGIQVLHSGGSVLGGGLGLGFWGSYQGTSVCADAQGVSWSRAGMSRSMWSNTHDSGWAAAKISQPLPSSLPVQQWVNRWSLVSIQLMYLHHISFTDREGALCSPSLEGCGLRAAC